MNRPCTCGKLALYDRTGKIREFESGANCLTDHEVLSATTLLMDEWRRRFSSNEVGSSRFYL
jgi:hypothetical protein